MLCLCVIHHPLIALAASGAEASRSLHASSDCKGKWRSYYLLVAAFPPFRVCPDCGSTCTGTMATPKPRKSSLSTFLATPARGTLAQSSLLVPPSAEAARQGTRRVLALVAVLAVIAVAAVAVSARGRAGGANAGGLVADLAGNGGHTQNGLAAPQPSPPTAAAATTHDGGAGKGATAAGGAGRPNEAVVEAAGSRARPATGQLAAVLAPAPEERFIHPGDFLRQHPKVLACARACVCACMHACAYVCIRICRLTSRCLCVVRVVSGVQKGPCWPDTLPLTRDA